MVSLKADFSDVRLNRREARPQLVLKDWTKEPPRLRHSPLVRLENVFLASAAAAALAFFCFTFAASLVNSVQQSYHSQIPPQMIVISKTVGRGDTLAGLAFRYGDPNTYILQREDQIARANHLTGTTPLLPGQHLQIPVTNPILIAQIVRSSHHRLVASR
jgi:nucleoid-associated protein YgaU